ncbi:MAG: tyrosine-protein phosphatase [Bacilli bacterium]|nr:tyrosine-protein phosphatase [Bacilli bacterium]
MRNFRDLSYLGLKQGMLLRSDVLYQLTKEEKRILKKEHNLRLIVDLRRPSERKSLKDSRIFFVRNINLPLLEGKEGERKEVVIKHLILPDMPNFYREFVHRDRKEVWSKIFDLLLNSKHAILFHCSAGKDRTGVVIALILHALGYDKETIYEDYLLTNQNPLYYKEIAAKKDEESKAIFLDYFQAKTAYLDETYKEIANIYGDVETFFKECCSLDETKIQKLKNKFLNK